MAPIFRTRWMLIMLLVSLFVVDQPLSRVEASAIPRLLHGEPGLSDKGLPWSHITPQYPSHTLTAFQQFLQTMIPSHTRPTSSATTPQPLYRISRLSKSDKSSSLTQPVQLQSAAPDHQWLTSLQAEQKTLLTKKGAWQPTKRSRLALVFRHLLPLWLPFGEFGMRTRDMRERKTRILVGLVKFRKAARAEANRRRELLRSRRSMGQSPSWMRRRVNRLLLSCRVFRNEEYLGTGSRWRWRNGYVLWNPYSVSVLVPR